METTLRHIMCRCHVDSSIILLLQTLTALSHFLYYIEKSDMNKINIVLLIMLINKNDEDDDIMKFPYSYYLFKHIYFVSLSVYFSVINR